MADLNNDIASLAGAFEEFKSTNDARLDQIEKKGSADYVTTDKLDKINSDLNKLQSAVTDVAKKSNRLGSTETQADDEYKSAFNTWARKGRGEDELRSMESKSITTGDSSGLLVPKTVEAGVRSDLELLGTIRNDARVIQTSNDKYTFLRNNHGLGYGWVGETDARPETSTPTLSEVALPGGEIYANPAVSQRALDDAAFNLEQWLSEEIARAFLIAENTAFVNGDGVNKPQGFLTTSGLTTVKTGVAAGMPTGTGAADFLFQMIYAMNPAYRAGAKFYMAGATVAGVRTLKDSTGNYIWQPSLVAGKPGQLAGQDQVDLEDMDAVAAGKSPVAFADMSQGYTIADRIGIRTLRDPYTHKPYVHFYATKRVSGMVTNPKAFVLLKVGV